VESRGGARTFDGVFLTGLIAVLLVPLLSDIPSQTSGANTGRPGLPVSLR
jgi:hypothetical protein